MSQFITGSTKTYTHNTGLSCCFRQWRAESHCNMLHGYALQVQVDFECFDVDDKNWVVDFGGLKPFKTWLERMFDHTTLVACDDPDIDWFNQASSRDMINMKIVHATGCEAFSKLIFEWLVSWLRSQPEYDTRVTIVKVVVSEHAGNSGYSRVS